MKVDFSVKPINFENSKGNSTMLKLIIYVAITLVSAYAAAKDIGCMANGEVHKPYSTVSFLSNEFDAIDGDLGKTPREEGYSQDGYTLVLTCVPIIDFDSVAGGVASLRDIPHVGFQWTATHIGDNDF